MLESEKCAAIVPCLNEAAALHTLLPEILRRLPAVYVIDDGSTDGTAEVAKRAGAKVISQSRQGKGAALMTGLRAAMNDGFAYALAMDGDGQHSPQDIPLFLEKARSSGSPLVVGNRMGNPHGMPLVRRFVNWWMSRRLSSVAGQHLPDTQCGFRLIRLDVWAQLKISTSKFEMESEALLAFSQAGHRIESVPIRVIYADEKSKINPFKDTWRWFRWLRKARRVQR